MKRILLVASTLLVSVFSFCQNRPFGFDQTQEQFDALPILELSTFDHDKLLAEDTKTEEEGGRTNIGRLIPLNENATTVGTWKSLPNGDRVWQFRFHTPNAAGVCAIFNDLYLPQGSKLFFYPATRKYFVGPFSNEDCNAHGHFLMGEITGDDAIVEYYEPAGVISNPRLGLKAVSHLYRYVYDYFTQEEDDNRGGGAAPCEVDVNCPEGDDWTEQRDAVVRLLITEGNQQGLCSGTLVNTTALDCRKYLLTALHCGENVTDEEWLICSVRLNYQRSACTSGSIQTSNNRVGVTHLADSDDGGGDSGSDFLLLEIEDAIPDAYNPYFAGWDARNVTPVDSVVGIHHPSGDRKKISTSSNIISGTWQAPGYHWQVIWRQTATNWGVTEGGSSGSPIFNTSKRIVGHLTGGLSCCTDGGCDPAQFTAPDAPDFYGKIQKDWTSNANSYTQKLKYWLDPMGTNALAMDGTYRNTSQEFQCQAFIGINEPELEFDDISVFPSFSDDQITIASKKFRDIKEYRIYATSGKLVEVGSLYQERSIIPVKNLGDGIYYISFVTPEGSHLTKKFIVRH